MPSLPTAGTMKTAGAPRDRACQRHWFEEAVPWDIGHDRDGNLAYNIDFLRCTPRRSAPNCLLPARDTDMELLFSGSGSSLDRSAQTCLR